MGLSLVAGLLSRAGAAGGAALLGLYYVARPPWFPASQQPELLVNQTLVELGALVVLACYPTGRWLGLDRLVSMWRRRPSGTEEQP